MDNLDDRLKADAQSIPADVSPELEARLKAAVNATRPVVKPERSSSPPFAWWWISSLSGAAALFLVVVMAYRGADNSAPLVSPDVAAGESSVETPMPDVVLQPLVEVPLDVRNADFAEPLAEELEKLRSDIEKARDKVGDDLRFTL